MDVAIGLNDALHHGPRPLHAVKRKKGETWAWEPLEIMANVKTPSERERPLEDPSVTIADPTGWRRPRILCMHGLVTILQPGLIPLDILLDRRPEENAAAPQTLVSRIVMEIPAVKVFFFKLHFYFRNLWTKLTVDLRCARVWTSDEGMQICPRT